MKFKTNAKCGGCSTKILSGVRSKFHDMEWSMDLENADKVLECHGVPDDSEKARQIEAAIAETGFQGSWLPAGE